MKKILLILIASLGLFSCNDKSVQKGAFNDEASIPPVLNFQRLGLRVITSFISKKPGTMSTLYGNELAVNHSIAGLRNHTSGEIFALVTWKQKNDPDWFGAKIPGRLQTVEMIHIQSAVNGPDSIQYQCYNGKNAVPEKKLFDRENRIKFIFDQKPSVMP